MREQRHSRRHRWINEHLIESVQGVDWYALVIFEGFRVSRSRRLPAGLGPICCASANDILTQTRRCNSAGGTG